MKAWLYSLLHVVRTSLSYVVADPPEWLTWLVLVIGWFADDSGVIVPAAALPFVVPLTIGMAASVNATRSSFHSC